MKQSCIVNSTMEVECFGDSEKVKEVVWLKKFIMELGVIPLAIQPMILFCDNSRTVAQPKEPRNH